jgi:hypothetical protein
MKTRIKIFSTPNADEVQKLFQEFMETHFIKIVDIRFSSTEKTFDVLILYTKDK